MIFIMDLLESDEEEYLSQVNDSKFVFVIFTNFSALFWLYIALLCERNWSLLIM